MNILSILAVIIPSLGGMYFGLVSGVIGGVTGMDSFLKYFDLYGDSNTATNVTGNIVSILQAGGCGGALTAYIAADRIGRKKALVINTIIYLIGCGLQAGSRNVSMMLVGRFIGGWGTGASTMIAPMYIAEICALEIRGRMGALWQLNFVVGAGIIYWINYAFKIHLPEGELQWRLPLALQTIPGLVVLAFLSFIPESVRWLILRNRVDEATMALSRLRGKPETSEEILEEIDLIVSSINSEKEEGGSKLHELTKFTNMRRILIGCFVQGAQQWTGVTVINIYGPSIFSLIGFEGSMSSLMTGIYGSMKILFTTLSFTFLDRKTAGRRPVLLSGAIGNTVSFLILGSLILTASRASAAGNEVNPALGYASIVFIYIFSINMEFTWAPVPWCVCAEIFPNRIRAICISLTTAINWGMNAIIGKITPLMIARIDYGIFYFYAAMGLTTFICVLLFLPETQGKSLEEIDEVS
ncbi:general substrate transporter [Backusella circina FSU 941]|nr:general substrate transporter [Backusella circina FSU 941]